jgi:hypothetical protein
MRLRRLIKMNMEIYAFGRRKKKKGHSYQGKNEKCLDT